MSIQGYVLVKVSETAPRDVKTRIRKLMKGTTVTIRGKGYRSRGLIEEVNGVALTGNLYIIPLTAVERVIERLSEKKLIDYVEVFNICTCPCR
ncbi:MAG: hypothetical protein LM572_05640 [Ignisphaera sp.]|nr:hypothetical protein [Ignisphaera sp.]MCC6055694.1 hypothetical protein [Desulfurococcaceae archaeon]